MIVRNKATKDLQNKNPNNKVTGCLSVIMSKIMKRAYRYTWKYGRTNPN